MFLDISVSNGKTVTPMTGLTLSLLVTFTCLVITSVSSMYFLRLLRFKRVSALVTGINTCRTVQVATSTRYRSGTYARPRDVVSYHNERRCPATLTFTANGQSVQVTKDLSAPARVGQTLTVRYNTQDPSDVDVSSVWSDVGFSLMPLLFIPLFVKIIFAIHEHGSDFFAMSVDDM